MKKRVIFGLVIFFVSAAFMFADGYKCTETPVILPEGTEGSFGTEKSYFLFGDWPQAEKKADIKIDEKKSYEVNDWTCYKGSDNCFYVKKEINHPGSKAAKDIGYFKMEPIKWVILSEDYKGGALALAEDILEYKRFDNMSNNYGESSIREYLNGEFINKAFSSKAAEKINTTIVDNSADSTTDTLEKLGKASNSVCEDTEDKIFLLSEKEITNRDFSFFRRACGDSFFSDDRERVAVDYAMFDFASGIANTWWLRSPFEDSDKSMVHYVDYYGETHKSDGAYRRKGVVPAFIISF